MISISLHTSLFTLVHLDLICPKNCHNHCGDCAWSSVTCFHVDSDGQKAMDKTWCPSPDEVRFQSRHSKAVQSSLCSHTDRASPSHQACRFTPKGRVPFQLRCGSHVVLLLEPVFGGSNRRSDGQWICSASSSWLRTEQEATSSVSEGACSNGPRAGAFGSICVLYNEHIVDTTNHTQ